MAQISCTLLVVILTIFSITGTVEPTCHRCSRARAFLERHCQSTRHPKLCVQGLLRYVNATIQTQEQLAQIALSVSLEKARYTRAYVVGVAKQVKQLKPRDYVPLQDCLDQINDSVTQIAQSIKEFRQMNLDGEDRFSWHESNVISWVGTALTDAMMCMDGFSGHAIGDEVKANIKARVQNVADVTSNALALISGYAARHRASFRAKKP